MKKQSSQIQQTPSGVDTKGVVKKLEELMDGVTKEECTPKTVNAAVNCAKEITNILKVHIEVERLKFLMKNKES